MAQVRLTVGGYDQPLKFGESPEDPRVPMRTTRRTMGEVFEVGDEELARLRTLNAVEDYREGDRNPSDSLLELASEHISRMEAEHATLCGLSAVTQREKDLSQARLDDARRDYERAKQFAAPPQEPPLPVGDEKPPARVRAQRDPAKSTRAPAASQAGSDTPNAGAAADPSSEQSQAAAQSNS